MHKQLGLLVAVLALWAGSALAADPRFLLTVSYNDGNRLVTTKFDGSNQKILYDTEDADIVACGSLDTAYFALQLNNGSNSNTVYVIRDLNDPDPEALAEDYNPDGREVSRISIDVEHNYLYWVESESGGGFSTNTNLWRLDLSNDTAVPEGPVQIQNLTGTENTEDVYAHTGYNGLSLFVPTTSGGAPGEVDRKIWVYDWSDQDFGDAITVTSTNYAPDQMDLTIDQAISEVFYTLWESPATGPGDDGVKYAHLTVTGAGAITEDVTFEKANAGEEYEFYPDASAAYNGNIYVVYRDSRNEVYRAPLGDDAKRQKLFTVADINDDDTQVRGISVLVDPDEAGNGDGDGDDPGPSSPANLAGASGLLALLSVAAATFSM